MMIGGVMSRLFPYIRVFKKPLKTEGIIRAFYLSKNNCKFHLCKNLALI